MHSKQASERNLLSSTKAASKLDEPGSPSALFTSMDVTSASRRTALAMRLT